MATIKGQNLRVMVGGVEGSYMERAMDVLEERYGSRALFWAVFVTALVSGMVHWLFFPGTALMGASGIVFMMIVMSSLSGMREGSIPLTLILVLVLYIGKEVIDGVTLSDNVSQLTHIIGGLCGAFLGLSMRR